MAKKKIKAKKNNSAWGRIKAQQLELVSRNPHRSFQLTKRRDYTVKLPLPGYLAFTIIVMKFLKANKNTFLLLVVVGCLLVFVTSSFMAQNTYLGIIDNLSILFQGEGSDMLELLGDVGKLSVSFTLGLFGAASDSQAPLVAMIVILIWLTSVWLVRHIKAGKKVRLRDGLFNSGGPIIPSAIVLLFLAVQLIPLIVGVGVYNLALESGVMAQGVVAMAITIGIVGLAVMSLYWASGSFMALIIVTLPGVYPVKAMRMASSLVSGIRLKILYRILWMALVLFFVWLVVVGVSVSLEIFLRTVFDWFSLIPLVPMVVAAMSIASLVWISIYVYILYIQVVEARHDNR